MSLTTRLRTAFETPRTLTRVAAVCLILNFVIASFARHAGPGPADLLDAAQGFCLGVSIPLMLIAVRLRCRQGGCASH